MCQLIVAAPVCMDMLLPGGARFGGAVYSAMAASTLGFPTRILGSVGKDDFTELAELFTGSLVDTQFLFHSLRTRRVVIINPDEVVAQQTIVIEDGDCECRVDLIAALAGSGPVLTYGHCFPLAKAVIEAVDAARISAVDVQDLSD